jgi:3-hydroxyisobutyrate dehydrogenase
MLKVGFIGLGNVGGKLAGSLLRNGVRLTVRDLDAAIAKPFLDGGAEWANSPREMAQSVDVLITCLPSPAASAMVMEAEDGALAGLGPGKIWAEMSTTDKDEVLRLGEKVRAVGAEPVDCPVSGGCHRAATGNIAIFAGCERATFETMLPLLTKMGRRILHTGELGSASVLKVVTNYLATANLLSLCEALVSFTMDLVCKDIGLFNEVAKRGGLELELASMMQRIFEEGQERYGSRELSPNIIKRLEEAANVEVLAPGFPPEMFDDEPEEAGYEVQVKGR